MSQKTENKAKKPEKKKQKKKATQEGRNADGTFAIGNNFSTIYKDEFADQLIEFFKQPLTRTEMKKTYFKGELSSETPIEFANDFPTMGMFARSIGVSVSAIKAWAGVTEDEKYKHDRFALAYACVKEWAEGMLESGAIAGKLDSNMAKFVLTNDYGKKDSKTVETSLAGIDEKTLAVIERVSKRLGNG